MSRVKNASRNIFFGVLNKCVSILGPFIMRTIILYKLGAEYVGLSGMFTSLLQVLNFAELGFANAIIFSMYKPIVEKNEKKICEITNYLRKIYKIISIVILIIGIILLPFLKKFVSGDVPNDINLYILYCIYLVNLISGYFLFAYKSSVLLAYQRNDVDSFIQMVGNLVMYLFQAILLLKFKNYYLYVICLPLCTIAVNIWRSYKVKKLYPNIHPYGKIDIELKKDIKKKVISLAGHKIGLPITNSIDSLVVSAFLGLTVLSIYDNYSYVFQALGTILTICYTSITPIVGNSIVVESIDKNYDIFMKLSFLNLWVVSWFSICMMLLYQNFMYLWVGNKYLLSYLNVIFLSVAFFIAYMRFITTTYKDACGMWNEDRLKPYVICFSNLILDIIAIKYLKLGVSGVILTTLFLRAFVAIPWETAVLFNKYFKFGIHNYIKLVVKWSIIFIISALGCIYLSNTLIGDNYSFISFVERVIIAAIVPNLIFLLLNYKSNYLKSIKNILFIIIKRKDGNI